jgi:flagellar hook assembly protein FlgD
MNLPRHIMWRMGRASLRFAGASASWESAVTSGLVSARTLIEFAVPDAARLRVAVFDIIGRRVRTLVAGPRQPGTHQVIWNGRDDAGHSVGTGVYLCRLTAGTRAETRRMLLLK